MKTDKQTTWKCAFCDKPTHKEGEICPVKLRRQVEDYLRKYAGINELRAVAEMLGIGEVEK
jgi:hypothetical protein